jgi:hypothetical protein
MGLGPDLPASAHGTDGLGHEEPSLAALEGLGGVDQDGDHLGRRPHFRVSGGSWWGSLKIQGGFLFSSPLDVTDLAIAEEGLVVIIRKSKTDQMGVGRKIGIPFGEHPETCPVKAVQAWIDHAFVDEGPLFRSVNKHGHVMASRLSDQVVADVVKRSLVAAGKSGRRYAAHSLRTGLIT